MLFAWEYLPRPSRTCLVDPFDFSGHGLDQVFAAFFFAVVDFKLLQHRCLRECLRRFCLFTQCDKKLHKSHEWRLGKELSFSFAAAELVDLEMFQFFIQRHCSG